jgi:paraquat-inducible protein A
MDFTLMKVLDAIIVCKRCDAVYRRPALAHGQVARCSACDSVVWRSDRFSVDHWLALTITSAIVFVLTNAFPVISIDVHNFQNKVTLWEATTSLATGAWALLAVPAIAVTIIAPLMQITLLGWILAFAKHRKRAPCFSLIMKALAWIHPWSMIEVAMLGVIVAGIKLSDMAQVSLGVGAWSMLTLTCLTALTTKRDLRWLWNSVDVEAAP